MYHTFKVCFIENVIVGTVDAAPGIATHMQIDDNVAVSVDYLELFFNSITSKA